MLKDLRRQKRIHALSSALRTAGVVDYFGLGELLDDDRLPSKQAIAARLNDLADKLPPSISVEYLAGTISAALDSADGMTIAGARTTNPAIPELLPSDADALAKIKPGKSGATLYHKQIFRSLTAVLATRVRNGRMEVKRYGGRMRADIQYDNVGDGSGFFVDLIRRHGIPAQYIHVECKNYSEDPSNPEIGQLSLRLNAESGKFGMLICRDLKDRAMMSQRVRDLLRKQEYIIVLDDNDINTLVLARLAGKEIEIDRLFNNHLDELRLN